MTRRRDEFLVRTIFSVVAVLVALALGAAGFRMLAKLKQGPARELEPPPLVRVGSEFLRRQDYQEEIAGYGRVRALRELEVAAEVQGVVVAISPALEGGATIAAGDTLLRIDDFDYRRAEERLRAQKLQLERDVDLKEGNATGLAQQLEVARREFELAVAEARRTEELRAKLTAADRDVDSANRAAAAAERVVVKFENDLALARIEVDRARASLAAVVADLGRAERDLARCEIIAPWPAIVVDRAITLGSRVAAGTRLCRLVDPSRVEVAIALPASYKDSVAPGSAVSLRRPDRAETRAASVTRVAPEIDPTERSFLVYVELDAEQGPIPAPGDFLAARVTGPRHRDVYVIPRTAFLGDELFVLKRVAERGDEARVEARRIELERILPDVALSRDPAAEGLEFVTDNLEQIASGSRVAIRTAVESGK
ncbi:MAG: HlyD family efflux transporter periplasmic adaptor subunit [Planctomycetes bacterium]|nr:HlyD family efflux transporter periplasmic adaptor subunit [Planctomycetota bacterium]